MKALRSKINDSEAHKYIREMKEINALLESAQMNKTPIGINIGKNLNSKVLFNYIYILLFSYIFSIVKVISIWGKWRDIEKWVKHKIIQNNTKSSVQKCQVFFCLVYFQSFICLFVRFTSNLIFSLKIQNMHKYFWTYFENLYLALSLFIDKYC